MLSTQSWRSRTGIILVLGLFSLWIFSELLTKSPYHKEKFYGFRQMKQENLIFLGDSMTDWHNWHHFGAHYNAGISGDTTAGLLARINTITERKPHTVVLMIGVNDLLNDKPLEQVKRNYSRILDALSDTRELIILSTLPVIDFYQADQINANIKALNTFLKNEVQKRHIRYIDLHTSFWGDHFGMQRQYTLDGVHLNSQGYLLWENILKKEFPSGFSK